MKKTEKKQNEKKRNGINYIFLWLRDTMIFSLFFRNVCFFVLISTTIFAGWNITDFNKKFVFISARNGLLVGIEEKSNLSYKWKKPFWEKLSADEFLSLATDGTNIVGIRRKDNKACTLDGRSVFLLGSQNFILFDQLVFNNNQIIGRGKFPYTFVYRLKDGARSWNSIGDLTFLSIDASGVVLCGIQSAHGNVTESGSVFVFEKGLWQMRGKQKFKQIATNGTRVIGIGPNNYVFEWRDAQWYQYGKEQFMQIAFDKSIIAGIQDATKLILQWNANRWVTLGSAKFLQCATDGGTIYGLAKDNKVYYWSNR